MSETQLCIILICHSLYSRVAELLGVCEADGGRLLDNRSQYSLRCMLGLMVDDARLRSVDLLCCHLAPHAPLHSAQITLFYSIKEDG